MPATPPAPSVVTLSSCPVDYQILYRGYPQLNGDAPGGWSSQWSFKVALNDMYTFCQFCAGTPQTYTVSGSPVTRIIPLSDPVVNKLLCQRIRARYAGGWTPSNPDPVKQWSHGVVDVEFRSVPYAIDGSTPFYKVNTRRSAEVYTLAGVNLAFQGDGSPIQADAGVTVPTIGYLVTIYQCTGLDDATVGSLAGKVNNATFLGWPAGTLRFDGMETEDSMTSNFQISYTRQLALTYRPVEWNKFLRRDGVWDYAQKPGGAYVYASASFAPLLA